jgi:hypothetical protein
VGSPRPPVGGLLESRPSPRPRIPQVALPALEARVSGDVAGELRELRSGGAGVAALPEPGAAPRPRPPEQAAPGRAAPAAGRSRRPASVRGVQSPRRPGRDKPEPRAAARRGDSSSVPLLAWATRRIPGRCAHPDVRPAHPGPRGWEEARVRGVGTVRPLPGSGALGTGNWRWVLLEPSKHQPYSFPRGWRGAGSEWHQVRLRGGAPRSGSWSS